MPNMRVGTPAYRRLTARRDKWAGQRDGQVTITEAIERLLDIADAVDKLDMPTLGRISALMFDRDLRAHTAPGVVDQAPELEGENTR